MVNMPQIEKGEEGKPIMTSSASHLIVTVDFFPRAACLRVVILASAVGCSENIFSIACTCLQ